MKILPFETERWFARYEFTCRHMLASSDCESLTIGELLELAGVEPGVFLGTRLGYGDGAGGLSLRAAIAGTYEGVEADDVIVLGAPQEGIFLLLHALLEPGDGAVVVTPCYDSLRNLVRHVGAEVHPWEIAEEGEGWRLDLDALEASLAEHRPRLLILNFPHNPTGHQPDLEGLDRILSLARAAGVQVFCDEMYRGLALAPVTNLPSAVERDKGAIVLGGMSKSYGLPGLRCGWLVVRDAALRDRILDWKHYTTICPTRATEALAEIAVGVREALFSRHCAQIASNLTSALAFFGALDGFTCRPPLAGSVALVRTPWRDAQARCQELAESHGVLLLPGACLGAGPEFVRIGLGRAGFEAGLEALGRALRSRAPA